MIWLQSPPKLVEERPIGRLVRTSCAFLTLKAFEIRFESEVAQFE
jgi:hypothetical protein